MEQIEKEIINEFKNIQEKTMKSWIYGDQNGKFDWKLHFEQDKDKMNNIISKIDKIIDTKEVFYESKYVQFWPEQRMFHVLGYIPRDSEFTYPMNCFLYHYIKKHCPKANIEIASDGSIIGSIKNKLKNNNVCLNAHMDIINVDRQNRDRIWYGAFGKGCEYKYEKSKDSTKLFLKRNNPKTPLGADDGKGIATILNILKNYDENSMPNLTFFLSSIEENDLYSMKHFAKNEKNIKKLFPDGLNNIAFINLDAFEGKEIDLYSNQNIQLKPLENEIIKTHNKYVEEYLKEKPTQDKCWTDPMSDAFSLKMWINRLQKEDKLKGFKAPLLISVAPTSLNPHSIKETIDMNEFYQFQQYIKFLLLPPLSVYKSKKLSTDEINKLKIEEQQKKIKHLKEQVKICEKNISKINNSANNKIK